METTGRCVEGVAGEGGGEEKRRTGVEGACDRIAHPG